MLKSIAIFVAGLIAAPVLLALAGAAAWLPSNAVSAPAKWETSIGGRALDASLQKRARGLKNPIAANDTAALAAGRKLYANNCAGCHGDATAPSDWGSKGFYPRVPQFWQDRIEISPEEAYAAIHDGIRYSGMGAWRDLMKEDDMWKVANFVSRIQATSRATERKANP
jgi:mono/diheme cytochrome c family protein